mgnify:CR=1 FL=1
MDDEISLPVKPPMTAPASPAIAAPTMLLPNIFCFDETVETISCELTSIFALKISENGISTYLKSTLMPGF